MIRLCLRNHAVRHSTRSMSSSVTNSAVLWINQPTTPFQNQLHTTLSSTGSVTTIEESELAEPRKQFDAVVVALSVEPSQVLRACRSKRFIFLGDSIATAEHWFPPVEVLRAEPQAGVSKLLNWNVML